jgi:hypothetical protein
MRSMKEIVSLLALEIGRSKTDLKKWRQRGGIPHRYRLQMMQVAARKGWPVDAADFDWKPSLKSELPRWKKRMAAAESRAA